MEIGSIFENNLSLYKGDRKCVNFVCQLFWKRSGLKSRDDELWCTQYEESYMCM